MPYVHQAVRSDLDALGLCDQPTAGELNYLVTKLCLEWISKQTAEGYTTYNEVVGVLECAKLEMYRRAVAPYEDEKIAENGDVYGVRDEG